MKREAEVIEPQGLVKKEPGQIDCRSPFLFPGVGSVITANGCRWLRLAGLAVLVAFFFDGKCSGLSGAVRHGASHRKRLHFLKRSTSADGFEVLIEHVVNWRSGRALRATSTTGSSGRATGETSAAALGR